MGNGKEKVVIPTSGEGLLSPGDLKKSEPKETTEERKERELEEKKNQELILEYLDKHRTVKIMRIAILEIVVSTNLHDEEVLCQQVADEKGFLLYQLRSLGAVIAVPRVNDKSLPMIDFEKDSYEKQQEILLKKYDFFRKEKGAAILDILIEAHLSLEQQIRTIMTAERLKNW